MLQRLLLSLFIVVFVSCNTGDKTEFSVFKIHQLQQLQDSVTEDSLYQRLLFLQKKLNKQVSLPDSLRAENAYLLGAHFERVSNLDSSATYFYRAAELIKDSITREREIMYFKSAWGAMVSLEKLGNCLVVLDRFEKLLPKNEYVAHTWIYSKRVWTYKLMKQYEKALGVNQAQAKYVIENDPDNLPAVLVSEAELKFRYTGDKKGASAILKKLSRNDSLSHNLKRQVFGNLGVYTYLEGNHALALDYYLKAIEHTKKMKDFDKLVNRIATGYNNIAEAYIALGEYSSARKYLDSVRGLGVENLEERQRKSLLNYEWRLANATNSNLEKVTAIFDEIYSTQNALVNRKLNDELIALSKANEQEKLLLQQKQAIEIENITLQSRILVLIVSLVLLGTLGFLLSQRRRMRFQRQQLQGQQRLLRSQMNPHFTFNAMQTIQNLLHQNSEGAEKFLVKFSRLLRLTFENSTHNYVSLEKELEAVRAYLDLQLLRYPKRFTYEIDLQNLEEEEAIFIPPMLIQPFVENSIEHGFSEINYPGEIRLTLRLQDKFIHCSIIDNGKGLSPISHSKSRISSTQLISDFLKKHTKVGLQITNKKETDDKSSGLSVAFLIPYTYTAND